MMENLDDDGKSGRGSVLRDLFLDTSTDSTVPYSTIPTYSFPRIPYLVLLIEGSSIPISSTHSLSFKHSIDIFQVKENTLLRYSFPVDDALEVFLGFGCFGFVVRDWWFGTPL